MSGGENGESTSVNTTSSGVANLGSPIEISGTATPKTKETEDLKNESRPTITSARGAFEETRLSHDELAKITETVEY